MARNLFDRDPVPFDDDERLDMEAADLALDRSDGKIDPVRKAELEAMARATLTPPKKQISARLSVHDLSKLKAKAMEKGIPYQTLLSSIVHQYVEGRLVEKG